MALDPKLLEILACPDDKGPLLYFADETALYNPRLKRRYRVLDGDIPDLLIDDAETVDDAEDDAPHRRRPRPTASSPTFDGVTRRAVTDSLDFLDAVAGLPEQLAAAHEAAATVHADALPERRRDPQHRRARHGRLGDLRRRRRGRVQRRAAGSDHGAEADPHARVRRARTRSRSRCRTRATPRRRCRWRERGRAGRAARRGLVRRRARRRSRATRAALHIPCPDGLPAARRDRRARRAAVHVVLFRIGSRAGRARDARSHAQAQLARAPRSRACRRSRARRTRRASSRARSAARSR